MKLTLDAIHIITTDLCAAISLERKAAQSEKIIMLGDCVGVLMCDREA